MLYAPGLRELGQIREVCRAVSRPVNVLVGIAGMSLSVADLAAAGVRRISLGGALARAALGALLSAVREINHSGTFSFVDTAAPTKELNAFFVGRAQL